MRRWAVALVLAWGLTAEAQPLTGGLLGRGGAATYATMSPPATCTTAGQIPVFLGSPLALGCDAGLTYSASTDTLTTPTVAARNLTATALATPGAITVTPQGTTGATTVTYKLVAFLADGTSTEAGAASSTATSNATLSATNFNRLTWSAVTGATSYNVYRTVAPTSPATTGIIYSGTALTVDDTGLAGGGETAPTANGTGVATVGRVQAGNGTAAAPGIAFAAYPTWGFIASASGVDVSTGGTASYRFGGGGFGLSSAARLDWYTGTFGTVQTSLTSPAAATLQLGAATSTSAPVAQTLTVQGRTGTDVAGADWTHIGSLGAGSAASGKQIFQVGTPQASGSTRHVAATALTLQDVGTGGTSAPEVLFNGRLLPANDAAQNVGAATGNRIATVYSTVFHSPSNSTSVTALVAGAGVGDTFLSRAAAATWQLGAAAANADGVDQTIQTQGGITGTDRAAGDLTIQTGVGTGAAESIVSIRTPTPLGSGTTAQTNTVRMLFSSNGIFLYRTLRPGSSDIYNLGTSSEQFSAVNLSRATLGSKTKTLTDATPTTFATFTIADGAVYSGEITYAVKAVSGTSLQNLKGRVQFSATREGTTYTVSISEMGTQTIAAVTGTLTGAISISGTGGVITLSANFDSSLSAPTLTGSFRFDSVDSGLTLTFP